MRPARPAAQVLGVVLVVLFVLGTVGTAEAHVIGLSRGDYALDEARLHAVLTMRVDDALLVVPVLDADHDGVVSAPEIERAGAALKIAFVDALEVTGDGARCEGDYSGAATEAPDGFHVEARYTCPHAPSTVAFTFGFLDRLPSDHRHLATVHLARGDVDQLVVRSRPTFEIDTGGAPSRGFVSFVRAGVEHIGTGADHLAFLAALVLGATLVSDRRTRVGALVAMLTAFTVGHSASLALATLGGVAPGSRLVEPAVALSVAYVGAENLFARSVSHRWMLTLPFGFVHGFALAGGLLPLGLARSELPLALFGFNLGVEVGQLAVLALLLPPLVLVRELAWYPRAAKGASAVIAIAGLVWLVQRVTV
jgi:hypothetical protein